MSSVSRQWINDLQLNQKTAEVLGKFDRRRRLLLIARGIASAVVILLVLVALIACADFIWLVPDGMLWMMSAASYVVSIFGFWVFGVRPMGQQDPEQVARQLEASETDLREDLLSAVELANPLYVNGATSFRKRLQDTVATRVSGLDLVSLLPISLISRWLIAALVLLGLFLILSMLPGLQFGRRVARAMIPGAAIQRASLTKVLLLQPSPASGFVAQGDAIAIVAEVNGRPVEEVVVQWNDEDGASGTLLMSPRAMGGEEGLGGTIAPPNRYAVNLAVGSTPVHYRILAGDGVTLWETLTPLPRPRVVNFSKQYEFPDYSLLSPRTEEAEHGDLEAIIGTKVNLTVRFDEPVSEAMIHFDQETGSQKLVAKDGSNLEFSTSIGLRNPGTYQIDAVSLKSGLNNPYSPIYSIDPLRDAPPFVRWAEEMDRMMIVSPLDVIQLHGFATDDLPIDRIVQEFEINGQPASVTSVSLPESDRELDLRWDWDLLHRQNAKVESPKLQHGDFIRLRFVAIDRNSQRGESAMMEILVADEGFDVDRHRRLHEITALVSDISQWVTDFHLLMDQLGASDPERFSAQVSDQFEKAQSVAADGEKLIQGIEETIANAANLIEAGELEFSGIAVADLVYQQKRWMKECLDLIELSPQGWSEARTNLIKERLAFAKQYANEALRVQQYTQNILAELVTVAMMQDAKALHASLTPMLAEEEFSLIPPERFPRYLLVALGRMIEIRELLKANEAELPESTVRHFEAWVTWSDDWVTRLESAIENPPREEAFRTLVKQFSQNLKTQIDGRMIDGRIGSNLQNLLRSMSTQIGGTRHRVIRLEQVGRDSVDAVGQLEEVADSEQATAVQKEQAFSLAQYNLRREYLLQWLKVRESLQRARPSVDLSYAADTHLMKRVVENVTRDGYQPYGEETAIDVHLKIGKAYQVIEFAHEVRNSLQELTQLLLAERRLEDSAINKVLHANWLERFSNGLELPCQRLRTSGVPHDLVNRIAENRYNQNYNLARDRILRRRWNGEPMLTAEAPLFAMQVDLDSAMSELEIHVSDARKVLQNYVLSLAEQAREAAKVAEEAKDRTEERQDSKQSTAEELATQQQEVDRATEQTLESLMDLANTSSLIEEAERELARDADIASNQIQNAAEKAESLMEQATEADTDQERAELLDQTSDALQELAESLERTAEHFELAEQGEDLTESRQQLREDASSETLSEELNQRYDDAEQIASDAQQSAEDRLRELEQQLQQNQPMQQELSDIAKRATEAAQRTLEQVAEQERGITQALERSDASFQEKKTRAASELAAITQRAQAVDEALLAATEQAIGWANTNEARPKLEETRDALRDAIDQSKKLNGDQAPLQDMQAATQGMSEAIRDAIEAAEDLNRDTTAAQDQNIHQDEASRRRTKTQVERFAREARTDQLRSAADQRKEWSNVEQEANRRIQDAQRQKRDAENQMKQATQQLERNPDDESQIRPQIDAAQDQISRAEKSEQAARDTKDFASQRSKQTQDRENKIKNQPLGEFEKMNPAAELATKMTEQAGNELKEIQNALAELSQQMDFADELNAPQETLDQLANRQNELGQRVDEAAEQLQRAARHEERLGQQEMADQLSEAADAVAQDAAGAASEALESIQQASDQTSQSPIANQEVADAADIIAEASDSLSEMLQQMDSSSDTSQSVAQDATPSESSDQPNQSNQSSGQLSEDQQLAQTLDELDRQLASQANQQSGNESGQSSDGQSTSDQVADNESNQSESANQDAQGQPTSADGQDEAGSPTAGQASPTLANNVNSQSQQAARQRQQQLNPSQDSPGQSGEPGQQEGESSTASDQPGNGQMPDGGPVDTSDITRLGADWGSLRERKTDEVDEGRSATVSPAYRRQVEAYFRAITRKAADSKSSGK